ncbi:ATP-binding cassette, subfamily A (ABC1), member 1 [Paragonimus westermani]|uniref:ATP-binding cassette, subfamily A (ABC1), member 1 n=1 Tax=Paragonimus westermani TaxID=34504 RepID=A0A5J4NRK5_9TREM|nr:ATP-binding cassette, subfamily A (ABC1), member 1 [Paragonimus westermani]
MQAPTSGWARVAGYNVPRQLEQVRNHLGFCPQYNVLFDQLTVAEHIHFYASLRGIPNDQIKLEIEHLLDVLGFKDKRDCRSKTLSGGQKRKLSVAIAFVGNTSVVFLDEPTSGVDPFSRRSIWDLVMKLKTGRTIILTTHHMDEADILGDRIAIISQGRLKCYGSSLFLKANHGQGYHLILQRESPDDQMVSSTASGFSPGHVLEYVRRFMPNARLVNVTLTEVIIQLPTQYAHNGQFTQFFQHIDSEEDTLPGSVCEKLRKLGITAYGLSDTSLEEIFLELADDPADHQTSNTTDSQASEDTNEAVDQSPMSYFGRRRAQLDAIRMSVRMSRFTDDGKLPLPATRHSLINRSHIFDQTINRPPTEATSYDMVGGHQGLTYSLHVSVAQQLRAMFHKRFHHFKRYKRGWAIEFLLPVTLIILALLFVGFVTQPYSNPPMPIHPWLMTVQGHKLHVFYENHMYATGDPDLNSSELQTIRHVASNYEKAFTMPYGFTGTRCIPSSVYQILPKDMASCEHRTKPLTWNPPSQLSAVEQDVARNSSLVQCSCVEGPQQCPANAIRPNPPPTVELQTTDILYNLTAYNVTDYLLKTRDLFINKRFGGISFITSTSPLARGSLETLLNPQNPLFTLLGSLTPISPSTPDPFWSQAADTLRLMLPPTHHLQIWFDNKGYVSAPAYLNMLQNMQLRMLLTNDTSSDTLEAHRSAGIAIVNHPVELPPDVAITRSRRTLMLDVTLAIFTILALSFIPASCITFLVTERHTGSKHLQFVSGLNAYVYWISVYLWDIVNYLIPAGLCILVFVAFQKYAFVGTDTIGPFILLIFFYGLAVLPMLYPFSFVIRSPSTALIVLIVVNMLFGALTVMVTLFLDTIYQEDPELAPVVDLLKGVFLVLPQYCLGRGLYDLAFRESMLNFRHTGLIDFTAYENPLGWNVLGEKLLALGLQTVAFLTLVLLNHMYATGDPDLNSSELQTIRHVASNYEKAFTMPYGFTGTRCIPSSVYQILPKDMASCEHRTKPLTWNPPSQLSAVEQDVARNSSLVQCSCVEGPQQCPANAIRPNPPPTVELQTTDILYNLTAYNVTDYLLKTRDLFINKRFGGISFITSTSPLARGSLETLLNPQNPLFTLLGSLTPISPSTPDPFWSQAADTLRLMLPPTHHLQIWFDNKGYVSAPAYLNMLQNMQLRMLLTNDTSSDTLEAHRSAGIAIVNHPVELPPDVAITRSRRTLMLDVTLAIFTILALSFIPASCITFLVTERHTGSKHLQFVSGLNAYVYWISVYLWDIVNYLIPAGLCILVFVAFQKYAFVGTDTIGPFILLIFFYGLAVLPMLYPFSFVIRSPSTALIVLIVVNMLFGALTVMVTLFLDTIYQEDPELAPVVDLLKGVFLVLPQYCLGRGLYDLAFREFILRFRETLLVDVTMYENPLGWGLLGQKLCALGLQMAVFLVFVLCIENQFLKGPIKTYFHKRYPRLAERRSIKLQKKVAKMASDQSLVANDVQFEQGRVFKLQETNSLASTSAVSTIRLTKFFGRMKMPSVNQLTFAIHPGECFGLLGVNGAGKTTTFRMLTGSLKPTFGVAYVNGYNVVDQQRQAHRSLGFCPQFDAVHHLLTGRETLTLYARLRGVPEHSIPQTVSTLLTDMGLAPHADKVAGAYSGGNRRKLSTAIAILGDPQVIFLDEPTSGMDPLAKRFLWDQIIRLIKSGKSVLLTSHSMEECEALCDRLGIMANGQFRCLGSVQQLKNKFGSGYTVELRISESPESADQVRHTLQTEFPQLTVSTTQTKCYEYQFPQRVQLARLFETLNRLRTDGLIEQYSVKQTTLDQVFVNFSQMQMDHLEVSDEDSSILTRLDGNEDSPAVSSTAPASQRDIDGVNNPSYETEF